MAASPAPRPTPSPPPRSTRPSSSLGAITQPYADALATNGVIALDNIFMSRDWAAQRAPYAWNIWPDCTKQAEIAGELVTKQLAGGTARFGGPDAPRHAPQVRDRRPRLHHDAALPRDPPARPRRRRRERPHRHLRPRPRHHPELGPADRVDPRRGRRHHRAADDRPGDTVLPLLRRAEHPLVPGVGRARPVRARRRLPRPDPPARAVGPRLRVQLQRPVPAAARQRRLLRLQAAVPRHRAGDPAAPRRLRRAADARHRRSSWPGPTSPPRPSPRGCAPTRASPSRAASAPRAPGASRRGTSARRRTCASCGSTATPISPTNDRPGAYRDNGQRYRPGEPSLR